MLIALWVLLAGAPADTTADLEGVWAGTCSDDGKVSEVKGEVCLRGTGDAREISIWGGAYRFLRRPNTADETKEDRRTLEVTINAWDEKTRTFSFDRNRTVWSPAKNEPASVVHRIQSLKLVGADGMDETASETTTTGKETKQMHFVCTLKRVGKTVTRTGPNACPAK